MSEEELEKINLGPQNRANIYMGLEVIQAIGSQPAFSSTGRKLTEFTPEEEIFADLLINLCRRAYTRKLRLAGATIAKLYSNAQKEST